MHDLMESVTEFHRKHGFTIGCRLVDEPSNPVVNAVLSQASMAMHGLSHYMEKMREADSGNEDDRLLRAHLMIEELAETIHALARRDECDVLDGLCDQVYVAVGTAVTLDLPLPAGMEEVCRSNDTKSGGMLRGGAHPKGKSFSPTNLRAVIGRYRRRLPA